MAEWMAIAAGIAAIIALTFYVVPRKRGVKRLPKSLRVGRPLPAFEAVTVSGESLRSENLRGAPAVLLFVRGNWCPFCSRQIERLTPHYRRIEELGARLLIVAPKPLETTARVAEFYDIEFELWLDSDLRAARQLGLLLSDGVPSKFRKVFGADTLWPASLVIDAGGVIRYAHISKELGDRPSPERFVRALEAMRKA